MKMFATADKHMITSGLAFFDAQVGGLPAGELCLVSGGADTGKTVIALQYLIEGLKAGEKVALVTSTPAEDFISLAEQLKLPVMDYVYHNQLIIVHQKTQSKGVIGSHDELRVMLDSLDNEILPWEPRRLVVDSFVPLIALFRKDFQKIGLTTMFNAWSRYGLTTLLTTRMPASSEAMLVRRMLEEQAAVSLHLDEHIHPQGGARRRMVVRKLAHLAPPYPVYDIQIKAGVGIDLVAQRETPLELPKEQIRAAQQKVVAKSAATSAAGLMLSSEPQGVFDKYLRQSQATGRQAAYNGADDDTAAGDSGEQVPVGSTTSSTKSVSDTGFSFRV